MNYKHKHKHAFSWSSPNDWTILYKQLNSVRTMKYIPKITWKWPGSITSVRDILPKALLCLFPFCTFCVYACFFLPCLFLSYLLYITSVILYLYLYSFFSELQLDPSADQRRKTAKDWKPKYPRDLQQRAKSSWGGSGGNRKWPLFRPKKATNGLDQIKLADSSSAYSEVIFICREFEIREGKMRFQSFSRQKSSALSHIKYLRLRRALHHSPFFLYQSWNVEWREY